MKTKLHISEKTIGIYLEYEALATMANKLTSLFRYTTANKYYLKAENMRRKFWLSVAREHEVTSSGSWAVKFLNGEKAYVESLEVKN